MTLGRHASNANDNCELHYMKMKITVKHFFKYFNFTQVYIIDQKHFYTGYFKFNTPSLLSEEGS